MGSTGSGNFSDYDGYKGGSGGNQGGSSGKDKCGKAFNTILEDVATCEYYKANRDIPPSNSQVTLFFLNPRLAIVDSNNLCIGYLPTEYNYLRTCLVDGFTYSGIIGNSSMSPIPTVSVLISPNK